MSEHNRERSRFFWKNMLRGGVWLAVILGFFVFLEVMEFDYYRLLNPFYDRPFILYLIYAFSEFFFGIIPPELFMIWARGFGDPLRFVEIIFLLALISYVAGVTGYFAGRWFGRTPLFTRLAEQRLAKVIPLVRRFGLPLVIIAALTPVPFSATCMVAGSVRLPFRRFMIFAASRFLRFALYGWVVWHATL
jgi:membrane protein YqaA with SNARE-associated domain